MHTILLVESTPGDASVLASALRVEGFQVVQVQAATAAMETLLGGQVSLVVVDLMVRADGGAGGLELARDIRLKYPSTRVLMTSAYHLSERQLERADAGISGFIPKPYDVAEVVAFVRSKASSPPSSRRLWHAEAASGIVEKDFFASEASEKVGELEGARLRAPSKEKDGIVDEITAAVRRR